MIIYRRVTLLESLEKVALEKVERTIKNFSSPLNHEIENFLKQKAENFAKQGLSAVHLVFVHDKIKWRFAGYFALTNKHFQVYLSKLSKTLAKRVQKFATFEETLNRYVVSAPLIGQLGKNYFDNYNKLITGDELLNIACETVREGQKIFGGRLVYLECENVPPLINFYERNGFYNFGRRESTDEGKFLIQFLKYLK